MLQWRYCFVGHSQSFIQNRYIIFTFNRRRANRVPSNRTSLSQGAQTFRHLRRICTVNARCVHDRQSRYHSKSLRTSPAHFSLVSGLNQVFRTCGIKGKQGRSTTVPQCAQYRFRRSNPRPPRHSTISSLERKAVIYFVGIYDLPTNLWTVFWPPIKVQS